MLKSTFLELNELMICVNTRSNSVWPQFSLWRFSGQMTGLRVNVHKTGRLSECVYMQAILKDESRTKENQ